MEKRAIFAGSFDPFTAGHEDVVRRALAVFDAVVIGVGHNTKKSGLLGPGQRVALIRDVFAGDDRITVEAYEGLTADFCRKHGCRILIRGLRSVDDFEGDRAIEAVNKRLLPDSETFYLLTAPQLGLISSAVVKELHELGADISEFLPTGINDLKKYL